MKDKVFMYFVLVLLFLIKLPGYGQVTNEPNVNWHTPKYNVSYVKITDTETVVCINVPGDGYGSWVRFSSNTTLTTSDSDYDYTYPIKYLTNNGVRVNLNTRYYVEEKHTYYPFELHFDKIPSGCQVLNVTENIVNGFYWKGISIVNPTLSTPHRYVTEAELKEKIRVNNDGIVGVYENNGQASYKLCCVRNQDVYSSEEGYTLIYISGNGGVRWSLGDVKAMLKPTATLGLFKAVWYDVNKSNKELYVTFDGSAMKVYCNNTEELFVKMYPNVWTESPMPSGGSAWTGSGFALNNGYIVTNFHVVENAKSIKVTGIKGSHTIRFNAGVVAIDKNNDLALIKIKDKRFVGFGTIPYSVKTSISDVGESVFVLGYPLTTTMGKDIKLTTGVVSSRTGFKGDVALYQISAPIQPGNSGGPLFDSKGNLIGIVSAKHKDAENVGYAIKTIYLKNILESMSLLSAMPIRNTLISSNLQGKVKKISNFVFLIECSD